MKHLKRYLKLMTSKEYREGAGWSLEILGGFFMTFCVIGVFLFTAIGQMIWEVLMHLICIILFISCGLLCVYVCYSIFKGYRSYKKKWEQEEAFADIPGQVEFIEESEKVDILGDEEDAKVVQSKAPVYFLDITALEHYAGKFQNGFLIDSFNPRDIVEESNAILVTDQDSLNCLKEMEKDPDYKLYQGYSFYIKRYFDVVSGMTSIEEILRTVQSTNEMPVVFLTKSVELAKRAEKHGFCVKIIE